MTTPDELRAAVFDDPHDVEAWAVYGDWLASRGDARGELIGLELRIEAQVGADKAVPADVERRYAELLARGPKRWAGPALAELLARDDISRELVVEWRRGHLYLANIAGSSPTRASELLAAIVACDSAPFLTQLRVRFESPHEAQTRRPPSALRWPADVTGARALTSLRSLDIDGWTFARRRPPLARLDLDWDLAFPRLRTLKLRCPHVALPSPIRHGALRSLVFSPRQGFGPSLLVDLDAAQLPALEELHLFIGSFRDGDLGLAQRLLLDVVRSHHELRSFDLGAAALPPEFYAELARAPVIRSLRHLGLAMGTIGDEHLPALRALVDAGVRLESLDLTRNYLSADAVAELSRRFRGRLIAPQQKPDTGQRQVPVIGRYGLSDEG